MVKPTCSGFGTQYKYNFGDSQIERITEYYLLVTLETCYMSGQTLTDRSSADEDPESFDPVGTLALILVYFTILVLMWVFIYFVEFLGRDFTVVGQLLGVW